jgi:hypothetical protein
MADRGDITQFTMVEAQAVFCPHLGCPARGQVGFMVKGTKSVDVK